jgi:hypothetical protein
MSEPDEFTDRIDSPPVKPLSDDGLEQLRLLLFAKPRGTIGLRPVVCLLMRLDAVQAELDQTRSLRIMPRSLESLIDRERHSPVRVHAYLAAHGWTLTEQYPERSDWTRKGAEIGVLDVTGFADYERYLSMLVSELADEHGVGELRVLADIEAACGE